MGKPTTSSTKWCHHNNNNNHSNNNKSKDDEVMCYKKGAWTPEEDNKLLDYVRKNNGHPGNWKSLPKLAGILRCGKSCRLRWTNYLRPDINRGPFSKEEHNTVVQLHSLIGNRWAAIAARLPGRTDNDVKNYFNSHLKKHKTIKIEPGTLQPPESHLTRHMVQWESIRLETEARLSSSLHNSPTGYLKLNNDHFLCLWNTEVGESFRKIGNEKASKIEWPSSSLEAFSWVMSQVGEPISFKNEHQQSTYSDSAESSDPSDTAMNMLLDSPVTE